MVNNSVLPSLLPESPTASSPKRVKFNSHGPHFADSEERKLKQTPRSLVESLKKKSMQSIQPSAIPETINNPAEQNLYQQG